MVQAVYILILLVFWFPLEASEYQSHRLNGQTLEIQTTDGRVKLSVLHENAIEAWYRTDSPQLPSFSKPRGFTPEKTQVSLTDLGTSLTFATDTLAVTVNKSPFRLSYTSKGKPLLQEEVGFFHHQTMQGFRFTLSPEERLMGTGQRVLGMDRRGHRLPLYNRAHYGYTTESKQMNYSLPALVSDKKYTLLFDNTARGWLDLGKSEPDILQFEANGGRHAYIVMAGDTYPDLIHNYVRVTGKQPLPPRWAFGNHASRFGYRSQQQVLDTIAKYRALDVPVDSIILDLYWFGPDVQGHMGNLDWDKKQFPTPETMIQSLAKDGVKTVLITEPFVLTSSKKWQEAVEQEALGLSLDQKTPKTFDFFFGHTGLIDVFSDKGTDWFSQIYTGLAKQGVAGVWGDLGEPEVHPADMLHRVSAAGNALATGDEVHNAYGQEWGRLVYDALTANSPNSRPFVIMRAGFAGSQRYGMLPWTGDVSRSFGGLKPQVELSLQMGLLGLGYTHSDLGGFAGGEAFDQELYVRWLQYGVFQPIYRPHAQDAIAPEPVFHDSETLNIVRDYIKLRYRLFPYNYSLAYQNSTTGMPLMRPMFFTQDTTRDWLPVKDQYFWGDSFLVKPVTEAKAKQVPIHLPKGNWFDFWSYKRFEGGGTIVYPTELSKLPVLVKGGAIIPSVPELNSLDDYRSDVIRLDYYFDPEVQTSKFAHYEDNGESLDAIETGQFELLEYSAEVGKDSLVFTALRKEDGAGYSGMPTKRAMTLVVHNWPYQTTCALSNEQIKAVEYDKQKRRLNVTFDWQATDKEIELNFDCTDAISR